MHLMTGLQTIQSIEQSEPLSGLRMGQLRITYGNYELEFS